jgi:hypothetical protein
MLGRTYYYQHQMADRVLGFAQEEELEFPHNIMEGADERSQANLPAQPLIPQDEAKMRQPEGPPAQVESQQPEETDEYGVGSLFHNWNLPLGVPAGTLLGELLLYYFEWMSSHIVTDVCAQAVHGLLSLLLPKDHTFPNWTHLKNMLERVHKNNVVVVDLCPNDCMAYYDGKHAKLTGYKNFTRTKCPKCNAARYLTDSDGKQVTAWPYIWCFFGASVVFVVSFYCETLNIH